MPETVSLRLSDIATRHPYLVIKEVAGKTYLFHSKKTVFFTLNSTARMILDLCDGKHRTADIIREVAEKHDRGPADVLDDVLEYLATLRELEIIALGEAQQAQRRQTDGDL